MHRAAMAALAAGVFAWARSAAADTSSLTLTDVLARARARAPLVISARLQVDEARGRLGGATPWLSANPVIDVGAGRRSPGTTDVQVGLTQVFELGGQRGDRIAAAQADVAATGAAADDAVRVVLRSAALIYYRCLHAEGRLHLLEQAEQVAADLVRTAERRHAAGDAPILDVNLARATRARAGADVTAARADRVAALLELRVLLGMGPDEPLALQGNLADRRQFEPAAIAADPIDRPDLRALAGEIREADANAELGRAQRWPDVGIGFRYERDSGDDVVLGTLSFTLPVFQRGRGIAEEAEARARRLRQDLASGRRAATTTIRAGIEEYRLREEAVRVLAEDAAPLADENERLARKSYDAGALGLVELLLVRRETFALKNEYLDRQLAAAVAGIELQANAGVLR